MGQQAAPAVRRELEPTHRCIRCGREGVPMDAGLCELCNPLELSQPSATQMHGIAAVGIVVFIAVLAVAARVAIADTGPFAGTVTSAVPNAEGLSVTLVVANEGKKAAATTCAISDPKAGVGRVVQVIQTPQIQPGASLEFQTVVTKFGSTVIELQAECESP
jgi:hypothetical protein